MINITTFQNIVGVMALIGLIISLPLLLILSIRLRKNKWSMIKAISNSAPQKIRSKVKFAMESNMSWIVGSGGAYFWFTYPTLRFLSRVPKSELTHWRKEIRNIFGENYFLYLFFVIFFNLATLGITGFCIHHYLVK